MKKKGKKISTAEIAKHRLETTLPRDKLDRTSLIMQIVSDIEIFDLVSKDIKHLFSSADVPIGDEQLISVICDQNFFNGCETKEEKLQRIEDLSKVAVFKEPTQ